MNFTKNPERLLLIDILGALITTILLLFLVKNFNLLFGVTATQINTLAIFAGFICCFGTVCWFTNITKWKPVLITLAALNILYCFTTIVVFYSNSNLSNYGFIYFSIEIIIILALAFLEIKTALRLKS